MVKILGSISNDIIYTHFEIEHNADGTHTVSTVQSTLNFDVEHDSDGTHGAITPTSVTSIGPISGTTISGTTIDGTAITGTGAIVGASVSAPTGNAIKWKLFTGTTDADSQTIFAHGLTVANIIGAVCSIADTGGSFFMMGDEGGGISATRSFSYYAVDTDFYIDNVGASLQSQTYRVIIFYI